MLSLAISQFPFTAALLLLFSGRRLEAKSVIVDDSDTSRIIYSPEWVIGNPCTGCVVPPDPTQLSNGTWHNVTTLTSSIPFFTFSFRGTSIEARYIVLDSIFDPALAAYPTNASYSIDGDQLGTTLRRATGVKHYVYNQTLFSLDRLPNTDHTLRVELLRPSVLLLDYLVYDDGGSVTTSTSTSGSPSSSVTPAPNDSSSLPSSAIIGAVVGGVVAAVAIVGLGVMLVKYRRRKISRPPKPNSPTSSAAYPELRDYQL